jgi:hypothetical protein
MLLRLLHIQVSTAPSGLAVCPLPIQSIYRSLVATCEALQGRHCLIEVECPGRAPATSLVSGHAASDAVQV